MAKKYTTNRLPAITAPHPSKKRTTNDKSSPTASMYYFLGDRTYRVFWADNKGDTFLQLADKSKPAFPQAQSEMDRLKNFGRIVPISEIPIAEWASNVNHKKSNNLNIYLKGTLYE